MNALGPAWIVCIVLFVAGVWKVLQPLPLWRSVDTFLAPRRALRSVRRWWRPVTVRAFAVAELAVAVIAIAAGRTWFAAVGGLYTVFALSAAVLARARLSCGCFGSASSVATARHAVVALAAAAAAFGAALVEAPGASKAWGELPALGVPHVLLVSAGAMAMIALLTLVAAPVTGATNAVAFRLTHERAA